MSIDSIFENKILICAGSGGVGKTTVSSTLAWRAAEKGKKVLVFTIDPSKRLATCLGLSHWTGSEALVKKFESGGEMWASMIEAKKIFDQFVTESTPDSEASQRLLSNRLYQELSTSLSGSQEFTSLYALYHAVSNKKYDLIVLDTPPAQHTLDFIESPQIIFNLFNGPIVEWFVKIQEKKNSFFSLFNQSTMMAVGVLERLTGSEFLKELQDFFKSVSVLAKNIQSTVIGAQNLLTEKTTQFLIISNYDDSKLLDAQNNVKEFKRRGFQVHHIIVNKLIPDFDCQDANTQEELVLASFHKKLKNYCLSQVKKILDSDSRHFKTVKIWGVSQVIHSENELEIIENLSQQVILLEEYK